MKKTVTVLLTKKCNLNCSYCYESHKCGEVVDVKVAKETILNELSKDDGYDEIDFSFFGGEPFYAYKEIVELYNYAKSTNTKNKKIVFSSITNGTVLTEEMKNWLSEHKEDFTTTLSLDGTKAMHDINRNNSYDLIDQEFFLRTYDPAYVKMTISQQTLDRMAEGIIFLTEKGFKLACNLAYGIKWTEENIRVLKEQLDELVKYYSLHPEKEICSMLELPFMEIYHSYSTNKIYSCCSANREACAYDLDGCRYPCHMFFPMNRDKECDIDSIEFSETGEVDKEKLDEKCRSCPIASVCQQCYGSNWLSSGNIYHVSDEVCKINKITFKAKAILASILWDKGFISLTDEEELAFLTSVILINDM